MQLGGLFVLTETGLIFRFIEKYGGDTPDYSKMISLCESYTKKKEKTKEIPPWNEVPQDTILKQESIMSLLKTTSKKWFGGEAKWTKQVSLLIFLISHCAFCLFLEIFSFFCLLWVMLTFFFLLVRCLGRSWVIHFFGSKRI